MRVKRSFTFESAHRLPHHPGKCRELHGHSYRLVVTVDRPVDPNLEITEIEVGNPAHNVIPAKARARISIRFNDLHSGAELSERVTAIAERHGGRAHPVISGEPFLTPPGAFSAVVAAAVEAETGLRPEASTSGGTSDARFLKDLCPVIEFGLVNATMHKADEAVAVDDLETLARIYRRIALAALSGEKA